MKQKVPPRRGRRGTSRPSPDGPTLGGRYVLGAPLGAGAVAEVRDAEDTRLHRPVAVKLLRPELADEPGARQRFEGEAHAAASLSHPNIVQVYDVEVEDGRPYLVMERLPGRTLADEIKVGPLDPARAIELGAQVLAALHTAHHAGIVHRDVKPGNVLLATDGTWKVADFGIAKSMESMDSLTTTGQVMCTPGYVAPERLDGDAATPASDLYSVGVLLYEALSGQRPFVADTPLGVARLTQTEDAPPLDTVRPGLDPRLVDVVHRALERDPGRRYTSALEMREALAGVVAPAAEHADDATVPIRQPDPTATRSVPEGLAPAPAPRHAARWPHLTVLTWLVVAVMVVVVAVALLAGGGDDPAATEEAPPPTAPVGVEPLDESVPDLLADALERLEHEVQP